MEEHLQKTGHIALIIIADDGVFCKLSSYLTFPGYRFMNYRQRVISLVIFANFFYKLSLTFVSKALREYQKENACLNLSGIGQA